MGDEKAGGSRGPSDPLLWEAEGPLAEQELRKEDESGETRVHGGQPEFRVSARFVQTVGNSVTEKRGASAHRPATRGSLSRLQTASFPQRPPPPPPQKGDHTRKPPLKKTSWKTTRSARL